MKTINNNKTDGKYFTRCSRPKLALHRALDTQILSTKDWTLKVHLETLLKGKIDRCRAKRANEPYLEFMYLETIP